MVFIKTIELETKQQFEVIDITQHVEGALLESGIENGVAAITTSHTTASIRLNHFEPMLLQDIMHTLYRLVPQDISYNHDIFELREHVKANERSNGHAHIKALLLGSSETAIVKHRKLVLGERQNILFIELDGGRKRTIHVSILGDGA